MYYLRVWLILSGLVLSQVALSLGASELILGGETSSKFAHIGQEIVFSFSVKNTGNTTISDIALNDSLLGTIDLNKTELKPGMAAGGAKKYIVSQKDLPGPIKSLASAKGRDNRGLYVSASRSNVLGLQFSSGLNLIIKPSKDNVTVGDTINYAYYIKNVGDIAIGSITLNDDKLGSISLNDSKLEPGKVVSGTKGLAINGKFNPGFLLNNATAKGEDATGYNVTTSARTAVIIVGSIKNTTALEVPQVSSKPVPSKVKSEAPRK